MLNDDASDTDSAAAATQPRGGAGGGGGGGGGNVMGSHTAERKEVIEQLLPYVRELYHGIFALFHE